MSCEIYSYLNGNSVSQFAGPCLHLALFGNQAKPEAPAKARLYHIEMIAKIIMISMMRVSKITPAKTQTRFWRLVKECITAFFPTESETLLEKATNLRREVELWPIREVELFFHSEPIHVVYDLAGETHLTEDIWDRYVNIRDNDSL